MIQICAWCRREIRRIASDRFGENGTSHGICKACSDNIRFQEGAPIGEYLNSLAAPVYVVDAGGVVQGVNRAGCEAAGKDPQEIVRRLGGDVFECAFARLPEGCGRTVHCSGCTIRRSVMGTHETGEPRSGVPAVLYHGDPDEPTPIHFLITTVKVQGVVLLRVDEIVGQPAAGSAS
jgi:PAS domain-containing protein